MNNSQNLLSLEERARLYRRNAMDAFAKAQLANEAAARAEYLAQAANWHHLADDIERSMRLAGLDPNPGSESEAQPDRHR